MKLAPIDIIIFVGYFLGIIALGVIALLVPRLLVASIPAPCAMPRC